ncbi:sialic acid-binding Ig-like lectin 13 [Leucoraja erinacea]|uniref:sialic acid-binding Ig-like lectin 13 n=1 Tax=Leucoraja erinaceus TaxID=7782 RepID=UPI002453FCB9|nr:sialic acid-binding Ig-like lectin 13 [Leucoraja erinacea]
MVGRLFLIHRPQSVCFFLSLLQAVVSGEWSADTPGIVTAQNGLCARIPCHYRYPSALNNQPRTGIWFNSEGNEPRSVAFHSDNPSLESTKFRNRTWLSGNLRDNDCSLVIGDVMQRDAGPYFFRVEFAGSDRYNYHPVTQLHVKDFTDKPTIFPAEMVEGKPVNVTCSFNTTCYRTAPTLTWDTPADEPPKASHSVTQRGDTLTHTSVLSLTPALTHHGKNLTCRVTYPTVSSEQILTLTVQYAPRNLSITSPNNVNNSVVKEGNSAAFLCSIRSIPASNLTWRHLNETLNTTRSSNELWMKILGVTRKDAGDYQCVAKNEHGTGEESVTLIVEYPPEISRDSGCSRTPESVTCVCAARWNPSGELTWHLPLANLSGNQTHGRFHTWQVESGHLVTGFLSLTGGEGGENMTALCSVRNRHGEAMLMVYLSNGGEETFGEHCPLMCSPLFIRSQLIGGAFSLINST